MNIKWWFWIVLFLPIAGTAILVKQGYNVDTGKMLELTLQLVWGILVSLSGGIIYLSKFKFRANNSIHEFRKRMSLGIQIVSLPMVLHTLLFVFVTLAYTSREFLKEKFSLSPETFLCVRTFGDSLLISLIVVPAFFSIIVGTWCMYMAVYHEKENS